MRATPALAAIAILVTLGLVGQTQITAVAPARAETDPGLLEVGASVAYSKGDGGRVTRFSPASSSKGVELPVGGSEGLHYSAAEVEVWRSRAQSGPYRSSGDVSANSPGDWDRIRGNASAFLANPSAGRYLGPVGSGCIEKGALDEKGRPRPPAKESSQLRDAAFYYLVTGETRYRDAVKAQLLAQAKESGVDFSNTSRWCRGRVYDLDPAFGTAQWLTRLLFAYDYLGAESFTSAERALLNNWFYWGADYIQYDVDDALGKLFVNRSKGDYSPRNSAHYGKIGYYGSKQTSTYARHYNNRRGAQVRYVALAGVFLDKAGHGGSKVAAFQTSGKLFVKEWLMFSVYPEGWTGEFERWTSSNPSLGWAYSANSAAAAITIADAFARTGDTELYDYVTSDGLFGSQGGAKSIRYVLHLQGKYLDGTYRRYGTDQSSRNGDSSYLINGTAGSWRSVHDVITVQGNTYYQDNYVKGMYTRTGPGMPGYPDKPATNGENSIWTGDAGVYPGVLFMFGQMEGVAYR